MCWNLMDMVLRTPSTERRPLSWAILTCLICLQIQWVKGDWVDPDSPKHSRTTEGLTEDDNRRYELVFSDEFEQDGRTFHDGRDPRWTAIHKNDYTNLALHFYHHDNAVTSNGVLNITTELKVNKYKAFNEKTKKFYADKKHVQSAMLQGWNKFCFIGGIVEFKAKLPGDPEKGGLWPALWMLGNLARATYVGSSNFMWPFSYNICDPEHRLSQEINACSKVNHYGMEPERGRGSPEVDIIESMQGDLKEKLPSTHIKRPYQSASLQIAPGVEIDRPNLGKRPHPGDWYTGMEYSPYNTSDLNPFFYGTTLVHKPKIYSYQADALSANFQLSERHYERHHVYRMEWEPPAVNGSGGYLKWYTDDEYIFGIHGSTLDFMKTEIPSEPMYIIMNTAVSSHWGFPQPCPEGCECSCYECGNPDCSCGMPQGYCSNFPSSFEIDYVRVYQAKDEPKHVLGCDPDHRPTDVWIKGHQERYMSEGQRRPIETVQTGGATCTSHDDCGGLTRGVCTPKQQCQCKDGSTGPTCLAHDAFYDFELNQTTGPHFHMKTMVLPPGLLALLGVLLGGFVLSMTGILRRRKTLETKYQTLGNEPGEISSGHHGQFNSTTSYQHPASVDYAIPSQQKDVTYCVIDGRLVDQ